jgi:hypothetical protein
MRYDKVDQIKDWCPAQVAFANEKYNGMGSRMRGVPTAYLWSGTNHYTRGKYVSDGVWSPTAVSGQAGAMPILKSIMILDPKITFEDERLIAAEEFPKADKAPASHPEAHALLKDESQSYSLVASLLKALGLPATLVGGAATAGSETGLQSYAPFINFFKEYGFRLAIGIVALIVVAEVVQYVRRQGKQA